MLFKFSFPVLFLTPMLLGFKLESVVLDFLSLALQLLPLTILSILSVGTVSLLSIGKFALLQKLPPEARRRCPEASPPS